MTRRSIYAEGFSHKNPIPAACRIGNMLYSGSIQGTDPATGAYGETIERQCELMFDHVRRIVEAGGGSLGDIIKMTVWMRDRSLRTALNPVWLRAFPNAEDRPARHTMTAPLDGDKLIECDFIAVIVQGAPA
ncbi:RidA family protein [Achromobacter aloeverae]|uniref:RidA family protein n=1 Tax=Achromobacter aloeverae TaxID=1750518 RepID=A0A4Q1HMV6_9BURK|nr:Rid family hydrolase [Achromobacter aloeverae]RXN91636.1 RidA family protein [Achromobacter aloeverae]